MLRMEMHLHTQYSITGEEIFTTKGEIIGLFLKERIPYSPSPIETIRRKDKLL